LSRNGMEGEASLCFVFLFIHAASTSTKIQVFDDKQSILKETIGYDDEEAEAYQILKDIGSASAVLIGIEMLLF